jgi:hypothetical protein
MKNDLYTQTADFVRRHRKAIFVGLTLMVIRRQNKQIEALTKTLSEHKEEVMYIVLSQSKK